MLQESLFGRVEPKRRFDVEANLLSERQSAQLRLMRRSRRSLAFLAASVTVISLVLPGLYQWQLSAAGKADRHAKTASSLTQELKALSEERDVSVPKIADSEMVAIMQAQSGLLMDQIILVLNATPGSAAISTLKADMLGGELTISCSAEAERFESMREFLSRAATGPKAKSTVLSSSRRSEVLGSDGVAFDFVKKVGVSE